MYNAAVPKVTPTAEKPDLKPREFWCEQRFDWADGEVGYALLVMGCCDAERAAEEAAEYCEQQAAEYCCEHLIRVTDRNGAVTRWDVQGETSITYRANERKRPNPTAADGESHE